MHRGRQRLEETSALGVAFATAGMDFVSTSLGGKFEDAARPAVMRLPVPIQGRAAAYPYTGQSGYECMSQFISDARGLFGRNAAPTRVIRNASWGVWHAGRLHGWRAQLRNGGELARGGSCDVVGAAR